MTRAERKEKAEQKRKDIACEIADFMSDRIKAGDTNKEAIYNTNRHISIKMKDNPQEKTLYLDAVRMFTEKFKEAVESHKNG
jgi:hypothetical protein